MCAEIVRLGMVGTGIMGQGHIRNLQTISQARLVALCDLKADLVHSLAQPLGAAAYTDFAEMLDKAELDALYVCLPPHQHDDIEVRAAQKGWHLYVEKPVTLYPEQAFAAWEAIQKAGMMTQVGYQLRYFPNNRQMKQFLADKEIGTAHACRWGGIAGGRDWWRRYEQGGGQLFEQTTHQVDLLRWMLGEVEAVAARYSFQRLLKDEADFTAPDTQAVLLQFASGASATVTTSCALNKAWRGGMEFVLKDAYASLQGDGIKVEPEGVYPLPPLPTDTITADEAFVRAVATGDRTLLLSPYDDGLKTALVTLAANRSAEDGGRIVPMQELLGPLA